MLPDWAYLVRRGARGRMTNKSTYTKRDVEKIKRELTEKDQQIVEVKERKK
jgi:hypothetical protein